MADDATAAAASAPQAEKKPAGDEMAVDATSRDGEAKPADADDGSTKDQNSENDDIEDSVAKDDVTMADSDGAGEAPATANGTPAAGEKKTDKSKKKSAGVPEHKTKKLKAKKSKGDLHLDAKPGQLYLARMKGHPAWPSIIADDDMLPEAISKSRPVTAPSTDGTWRRPDYAPGGKRHNERTFAIMFLFTNEFAWIPNTDLTPITADDCKDVPEKNKSKALLEAYHVAAEGNTLEHYKGLLNEHANAILEEEQARAEREAEKTRKAEKKAKRKSEAAVADDDEMDVDEAGDSKPKTKKRKKEAGADDNEKPAKVPKTTKLKLSTPKTPSAAEKATKKKESSAKPAKKKSVAKVSGSDDDGDVATEDSRPLTAEEQHEKLRGEIRFCRHRLQRALLTRDTVPSDEEIKNCELYLTRLEKYGDLAADIIATTKIHKVLKGIIKLPPIPMDEQFSFKKRSGELLAKWTKILAENPQAAEKNEGDKKEGTANGEDKSDDAKPDNEEKSASVLDEKASKEKEDETSDEKEKETGDDEKTVDKAGPEDSSKSAEPEETKLAGSEKPVETIEAAA